MRASFTVPTGFLVVGEGDIVTSTGLPVEGCLLPGTTRAPNCPEEVAALDPSWMFAHFKEKSFCLD